MFGADTASKFPELAEDIESAGKCLALGQATACVFHLMRIMETGTQKFGNKVGVQLVSEKVWQVILDGINKAIKAMDQRDSQTRAYAEACAHLYNVKLAWRNEVMHPKQTYTMDDATKIFAAVDAFMRDFSRMV